MSSARTYHKQKSQQDLQAARVLTADNPLLTAWLKGTSLSMSSSSQKGYTYDLRRYLAWASEKYGNDADIVNASAQDISDYLFDLQTNNEHPLSKTTLGRTCAALNSFYSFLEMRGDIENNPMHKVKRPKIAKDKRVKQLTSEDVERLLEMVRTGNGFDEHQKHYVDKSRTRDYAILITLLCSGIRVSECVGLNIKDVTIITNHHTEQPYSAILNIYRKGDKLQVLPVGEIAASALADYMEERKGMHAATEADSDALFLSSQMTRLKPAAIENMLRKYCKAAGLGSDITPHVLRKTYGTNLYRETRDIYQVANALGHSNVNTTTSHYIADHEEDLQVTKNIVPVKKST